MAIRRHSAGRILAVTLGLAVAGAVCGAVAGVLALVTSLILSHDFEHLKEPLLFAVAATLGAMVGTACVPLAYWLLLQRIPLNRALGGLTVGATIGGVVGWFSPEVLRSWRWNLDHSGRRLPGRSGGSAHRPHT